MTTIAIIIGLLAANLIKPGVGVDMSKLAKGDIQKYVDTTNEVISHSFMEKYGCPKDVVFFVITTGYSFNLDGSTLYQALAAIFIAQMYGIELSITQQITLMLVLMITSKGILR